ncbi:hypothetical protein [Streptomyces sp. NPDC088757]|uniref:hypothetical protein n=1 Tax=Streptomyces sp. NPDC088757 TaxID=3365889 RepID=UPI00382C2D0E
MAFVVTVAPVFAAALVVTAAFVVTAALVTRTVFRRGEPSPPHAFHLLSFGRAPGCAGGRLRA